MRFVSQRNALKTQTLVGRLVRGYIARAVTQGGCRPFELMIKAPEWIIAVAGQSLSHF